MIDKFSFCTDVHGNLKNVDEFLRESGEREVDTVIFGGDIMPKKFGVSTSDEVGLAKSDLYRWINEGACFDSAGSRLSDYENGYILESIALSEPFFRGLPSFLKAIRAVRLSDRLAMPVKFKDAEFIRDHGLEMLQFFSKSEDVRSTVLRRFWSEYSQGVESLEMLHSDLLTLVAVDYFFEGGGKIRDKDFKEQFCSFLGIENTDDFRTMIDRAFGLKNLSNWKTLLEALDNFFRYYFSASDFTEKVHQDSLKGQRVFLEDFLRRVSEFRQQFNCNVLAILGNDDLFELNEEMDVADRSGIIINATNRVVSLDDDSQVLGYSYVPPLPFSYREWFKDEPHIETDLAEIAKSLDPNVQTIFNIHCSPADTTLSKAVLSGSSRTEYGSAAIRNFIKEQQPALSLHGHTHKSWMLTGEVKDSIGDTPVFNPGDSEVEGRFLFSSITDSGSYEVKDYK